MFLLPCSFGDTYCLMYIKPNLLVYVFFTNCHQCLYDSPMIFSNSFFRLCATKLKTGMLYHMNKAFQNTVFKVSMAVPSQCKIPKFHLIFLCGNFVETYSFSRVLGDFPESHQNICVSTKFLHQEIK